MDTFALIFDMDGTLLDNNAYHLKAWRGFLQKHGFELSDEDYLSRVSGVNSGITVRRFFGEHLSDEQVKLLQQEKETLYRQYIAPHLTPLPGLLHFLKEMSRHDIPMGVATSAPHENIDFTLEGLGVADYFQVVVGAEMVKRGKPDPEIFLLAAERLGFSKEKCIVFEDSISGLQAAHASGMRVVALRTAHRDEALKDANLVMDDYRDIGLKELQNLFSAGC